MKKYLMTGIAALAMGGMFTSCGPDMSSYGGNISEQVVQKYEDKFVEAFGEPAPNQTWGFGSSTVATTRGMTRAVDDYDGYKGSLQPVNVSFPSDCEASNFDPDLTGIPSYEDYCKSLGNANWTPDEFAWGEVYIDKVQKIHIWGEYGKRAKLYIKAGEYDFTNETFDLCADADLYLLSGAIVTLNNTAANTAKFDVYIAPGAKLIANGENGYRADVDAHLYNHGTIECTRFEVNNTSFLYNVGALTSSGDVYIANSISRVVNDGTINAASTHVEGSGAIQNNAEWTITGNTIVNCDNGGWVNNGHWTTQNYHYTAGSKNVINNCFLKVTNEFNINMSSGSSDNGFKIDSNGGVETVNFNGGKAGSDPNSKSGPYKVIMGHKSLFKVTGTATLDGGNKGWGFFGPADGEYAVFQAKNVVRAAGLENNQGAVTYGGNLYVSAETHFAQGNDGQADHYFIYEEGGFSVNTNIYASGFQSGKPDITINTTPCNPGFNVSGDDDDDDDDDEGGEGGGETVEPVTEEIRVIAEDLSVNERSDFDFNDVVFDVYWTHTPGSSDNQTVKIIVRAAGGELPIFIGKVDEKYEIHYLFGTVNSGNISTKTMMNTYRDHHYDYTCPELDMEGLWSGTNIQDIAKNIKIYVHKSGENHELKAEQGKAPGKIAVYTDFKWCDEWDDIDGNESTEDYSGYDGKFSKYVSDKYAAEKWNTWYKDAYE